MQLSHAQNTPQDFLNAHNTPRAQVGVSPMTWNTIVSAYAQNYANQRVSTCTLVHSGGPYVNLWMAEKITYKYNTNACATGKVCWHYYTQVVWHKSVSLGLHATTGEHSSFAVFILQETMSGNFLTKELLSSSSYRGSNKD
ncbi:hypothetical protein GIB67_005081 [Kingdonia uniflora]|uniref:SCP domain-containing protein n=1 Tax=Kingdonia uniflora TaxID=39325 RepID=A0A7J7KUP6_9MAGN|nr:hypothetical protein GIB67_005081 [Kingdonia uniflora]